MTEDKHLQVLGEQVSLPRREMRCHVRHQVGEETVHRRENVALCMHDFELFTVVINHVSVNRSLIEESVLFDAARQDADLSLPLGLAYDRLTNGLNLFNHSGCPLLSGIPGLDVDET